MSGSEVVMMKSRQLRGSPWIAPVSIVKFSVSPRPVITCAVKSRKSSLTKFTRTAGIPSWSSTSTALLWFIVP